MTTVELNRLVSKNTKSYIMTYRLAVGYTFLGESDNSRIASEKTLMKNVDGRSYSSFCLLRAEKHSEAFIYWCHESSRAINAGTFRFCLHVRRYRTLVAHVCPSELMCLRLCKRFNIISIRMLIIFIACSISVSYMKYFNRGLELTDLLRGLSQKYVYWFSYVRIGNVTPR
jgi:hypothetical protein